MTEAAELPRAARPFVNFATLLRQNGFAVAPDQTMTFLAAVGLLGGRSMAAIHRAAHATLAPPPERHAEFDALFRLMFLGQSLAAPAAAADDDEETRAFDDSGGAFEPPDATQERETGAEATALEALSQRRFEAAAPEAALRAFSRAAPRALPRRRSLRRRPARRGPNWNMRRMLRDALRHEGEVLSLRRRARRTRQRRILLLIDVSGSMKLQTDDYLGFAHVLTRAAERCETFTMGTRLTRVSRALRHPQRREALTRAATLVADWDGGTRLGEALGAFLGVPRFAAFARGAMVVVLSDGLERGDSAALVEAVRRLDRLAWRILWLTPLAGEAGYAPQTAGLAAILPFLDRLGDASATARLCGEILDFARRAA